MKTITKKFTDEEYKEKKENYKGYVKWCRENSIHADSFYKWIRR